MDTLAFGILQHAAPMPLRASITSIQKIFNDVKAAGQNEATWSELAQESYLLLEMLAGCEDNGPVFVRQVRRLDDFHSKIERFFRQKIQSRSWLEMVLSGFDTRQRIQGFARELRGLRESIMLALTIGIANQARRNGQAVAQAVARDEIQDATRLGQFREQFQKDPNAALAGAGIQLRDMQEWQIRRLTDAIQTATRGTQQGVIDAINPVLQLLQRQSPASRSMEPQSWRISPLSIMDKSTFPISEDGYIQTYSAKYHGSPVAVKQLFGTYPESDVKYFRRELLVWKNLNHPNILTLIGACDTDERLFMVSPLMTNGTLQAYITNPDNKYTTRDKIRWIYQVACGMSYLHANGVVHGNLTTANVSLDNGFDAVITDFGMSRTRNVSMSFHHNLHNAHRERAFHMAPELFGVGTDGPASTNEQSDVYAFAILCYEVMNKGHSWVDDKGQPMRSRSQQTALLRGERPPRIPGLNEDLWLLIQDCWNGDRHDRPYFEEIVLRLEYFTTLPTDDEPHPTPLSVASTPQTSTLTERELRLIQDIVQIPAALIPRLQRGDIEACADVAQLVIDAEPDTDDDVWKPVFKLCSVTGARPCIRASFQLAWLYFLGLGVSQNYRSSFFHWTEVSESASDGLKAIATQMLGWSHYLGRGTDFDQNKALEYMEKSNCPQFSFKDAGCFGGLTRVSSVETALFHRLCSLGARSDWLCGHLAAVCLFSGFGVARQQGSALTTIERLANEQSRDLCQLWLGLWLTNTTNPRPDPAASLDYVRMAADNGNPWAQNILGEHYEQGKGVRKDCDEAISWYRQAANQGNADARLNMGRCYRSGIGVQPDSDMAKYWFNMAAEHGSTGSELEDEDIRAQYLR